MQLKLKKGDFLSPLCEKGKIEWQTVMGKLLCGVDLGGTKLAVVLIDEQGTIRHKRVVYDHATKTDAEIVLYIIDLVRQVLSSNGLKETDLYGIGVGFPGHLRYKDGITITTSNLKGLKNFPLRLAIQEHFQVRVLLDNDANAQTYAEFRYGAGRGYESMIFVTVSTGIGGGIVINNRLYRGMTGTAGEFGHMIIDPHSQIQCGCGNYGCLMGCASGLSLPQIAQKFLDQGVPTTLAMKSIADVDGKMIKAGLDSHDLLCEKVATESARYIGIGLYNIFQVLNPPLIVLGGGLMNLGESFFTTIQETFYVYAKEMLHDPIEIALAQIGDDAGAIGVAALLLEDNE